MKKQQTKVLVTGATGLIGYRLCKLLTDSHQVVALSRSTIEIEGVESIAMDLSAIDATRLPDDVDVIIHTAQSRNFRKFPDEMLDIFNINIRATLELAEYARKTGVKKFINLSTGSIYRQNMMSESDYVNPKGAYPVSKYCGELVLAPYEGLFDLLQLRLFFVYGPEQSNMMVPGLIERVANGGAITLQGQNGLTLCPTYVDDVNNALLHCVDSDIVGTFNFANPTLMNLREVGNVIGECVNKEAKFDADTNASPAVFAPNLEGMLGWLPENFTFTPFAKGIEYCLSEG